MKEAIEELIKKNQDELRKSNAMHDAADSMDMKRYYHNEARIYTLTIEALTNLLKQNQ